MAKAARKTTTALDAHITNGALFIEDTHMGFISENEVLVDNVGDGRTKAIRVLSLSQRWVEHYWTDRGLEHEDLTFHYTIRCETRSGRLYWYAYKRHAGKLHKVYVGQTEDITEQKLADVARKLPHV